MTTDAVTLFREARQKSGQIVLSGVVREDMRRWLVRMVEEGGWTAEDKNEYLQAVYNDIQDQERLLAAAVFWRSERLRFEAIREE